MTLQKLRQIAVAKRMIRDGAYTQDIVKATGLRENTIYRYGQAMGIPVSRQPRKLITGEVTLSRRKWGGFYVPQPVCRAAGWKPGDKLRFTVDGARLTIGP